MCVICGQSDFIRCNCQSAQPFCDTCAEDSVCGEKMDSACVIYHFGNPTLPSKLIYLQLPNGSSAQTIFEKIDSLIGSSFNLPIIPIQTPSIHLIASGLADHTLQVDLNISNQPGNKIQLFSDGVYVAASGETFKVKVDSDAPPRYLYDAVVGGTDGCVNIDVNDVNGILQLQPSIEVDCLLARICANPATQADLAECVISGICGTGLQDTLANCIVSGICADGTTTNALATCLLSTGRFASTGTTSITADNGLNMSSVTNVELGGPLIKTTTIDQNTFQWNILTPNLSIGSNAAQTQSILYGEDLASTKSTLFNLLKQSVIVPGQNVATVESFLKLNDGVFVDGTAGAHHDSVDAQLWMNYSGNLTMNAAKTSTFAGIYGTVIIGGVGNYSGNILAGGNFRGNAAGSGNATDIAAVLVSGLEAAGATFGGAYSGTVTNYYGLYIRDVGGSGLAGSVTNKYSIFQEAGAGINSFSTAVVITSDARTKENITDYVNGLDAINNIRIVEYNIIGDDKKRVGVIAQDIENIIPEAVQVQDRSGQGGFSDTRVVDYNVIYSTLVKAVQELSAKNDDLEARLLALESK